MKKIDIYSLSKEDAEALDMLLSACAEAAVKEAQRKVTAKEKREEGYCEDGELTREGLNVLYKCYCESRFASRDEKHREDVYERLESELSRIFPTGKRDCYELLIPIMAYSLLVNNEYNSEAVRKRIRNDREKRSLKSRTERNIWGHIQPFRIYRRPQTSNSQAVEKLREKLVQILDKTHSVDLNKNVAIIQSSVLLDGYDIIMNQQDNAQIGLFLRSILLKCYQKARPMDTLIRFYLANRLDNLLIKCRNFPEDILQQDEKQAPSNDLLLQYWMNEKSNNEQLLSEFAGWQFEAECVSSDGESGDGVSLGIVIPADLHKMAFKDLYTKLISEFTISADSLDELMEFYLDVERLNKMSAMWARTEGFVNDVIDDIQSSAQTTKRTAPLDLAEIVPYVMRKTDEKTIQSEVTSEDGVS